MSIFRLFSKINFYIQIRRAKTLAFLSLLLLLTTLGIPQFVEARSFSFPELKITAEILPDGSMLVTEERTASFSGTYSGLYQYIDKSADQQIVDIIVKENGQAYEFNPGTEYGPAGTYMAIDQGDSMYIDWSFDATDEDRTFTLEYKITNVVQIHRDVAEFYHVFVGDEWEVGIDNLNISLSLPSGADVEDIRAWGHGPLQGNVTILSEDRVIWEMAQLPPFSSVTGRVTFPVSLVPDGTYRTNKEALLGILNQEQQWADEANSLRAEAKINWVLAIIIFVIGIVYSIIMWIRHGKAYQTVFQEEYHRELPADYTPAELSILWRFNTIDSSDMTATILDLARRGYLRIDETTKQTKKLFKTTESVDYKLTKQRPSIKESASGRSLLSHEQSLMKLLFEDISKDQQTVTFDELEQYAKDHTSDFTKFWNDWTDKLKKRGQELQFFEKHSSGKAGKHSLPGIFAMGFGVGILIWQIAIDGQLFAVALSLLLVSFFYLFSLATHSRRTAQAQEEYAKWTAFKKFLQDFSNIDRRDIPSLAIWEHYLVYAVTLGVAKEVIKQLQIVYPNLQQDGYYFGAHWYYYNMHAANFSGLANGIDTMTSTIQQSIQQSINTATSQSSSGSGGGGGFSGGGGGGFSGGGGGGAR